MRRPWWTALARTRLSRGERAVLCRTQHHAPCTSVCISGQLSPARDQHQLGCPLHHELPQALGAAKLGRHSQSHVTASRVAQVRRHHRADATAERQVCRPEGCAQAGARRPQLPLPAVAAAHLQGETLPFQMPCQKHAGYLGGRYAIQVGPWHPQLPLSASGCSQPSGCMWAYRLMCCCVIVLL